jgi:hypothetical protein
MRTTAALVVTLALALPAVAMPHPCEVDVAKMKKDLEAIRGAIATIEGVKQSDLNRQMLAGAKAKYDLEQRRTTEAQARCERLVLEERPGAPPSAASEVAATAAPQAPASATPLVTVPAPAAAVPVAPAVLETATPAAPCFTGCGKDTDCKGDRVCVNGACQDPPAR